MKKRYLYYTVLLIQMVVGIGALQAQKPVMYDVTVHTNRTNKELDNLNQECSEWSYNPPTPQRFKEVNQRLVALSKNELLKGNALVRLGQNYADVGLARLRNDSLAVEYFKEAIHYLPLPNEKELYSQANKYLGHESLYPGEQQNAFQAIDYLAESFKINPKICPDYGDLFMFGWGVKKDMFLAANVYAICFLAGNTGSLDQMNYINYFLESQSTRQYDIRAFEGMEHFLYASFILRDRHKAFYAITMAAELSLPTAMMEMALVYADNKADADEQNNRREAFHWFRESANQNYAPAILGLSRFCRYNVIDTLEGDIYRKDTRGNYSKEIINKVTQQSIGLLRRAAEMGYTPAQIDLGEILMNKPKYGLGKPDYIEAAKWITSAAQSSSTKGEKMLDVLQHKMDTAKIQHDPQEYADACTEGRKISNNQQYHFSNTLENILKRNNISHPSSSKSTPLKRSVTQSQLKIKEQLGARDNDIDEVILAIGYQNVYEAYADMLQEMSNDSKLVNQSKRRIIQGNMTRLRLYSQYMKYNLIKQSPWEEWNGK